MNSCASAKRMIGEVSNKGADTPSRVSKQLTPMTPSGRPQSLLDLPAALFAGIGKHFDINQYNSPCTLMSLCVVVGRSFDENISKTICST